MKAVEFKAKMKNKNMQYGHFDDKRHEYVITRPDTPKSWTNYLGSTDETIRKIICVAAYWAQVTDLRHWGIDDGKIDNYFLSLIAIIWGELSKFFVDEIIKEVKYLKETRGNSKKLKEKRKENN